VFFAGVALLIAAGLALLISADAGALFGLSQDQFGRMVPLMILAPILAAALFSRRQKLGTLAVNLATWLGIFMILFVGYSYRDELSSVASRVIGDLSPSSAVVDSQNGSATFRRGLDGHFTVMADVDGTSLPLMFDTGASAVVLSHEDAQRAGIDVSQLSFSLPVMTANGTGRAAVVRIERMVIGGIARRNVRAFVTEPGALRGSLLGMTFLQTLTRYSVSGDRLELID
jgi:aspartyl protease family protein